MVKHRLISVKHRLFFLWGTTRYGRQPEHRVKDECWNVLYIFEILLIILFANAICHFQMWVTRHFHTFKGLSFRNELVLPKALYQVKTPVQIWCNIFIDFLSYGKKWLPEWHYKFWNYDSTISLPIKFCKLIC